MSSIFNKIKSAINKDEADDKAKKTDEKNQPPVKDVKKSTTTSKQTIVKTAKKEEKKAVKRQKRPDKEAHKVIVKPLISEKGTWLGQYNKYLFEVSFSATKSEIKKKIANMYGIKPVKVNIITHPGKGVRYGRFSGTTKKWKKAVITLPEGQTIQIYEGV